MLCELLLLPPTTPPGAPPELDSASSSCSSAEEIAGLLRRVKVPVHVCLQWIININSSNCQELDTYLDLLNRDVVPGKRCSLRGAHYTHIKGKQFLFHHNCSNDVARQL
ncbi:hypothetical protein TYRP_006571 [Tyrophagus putrescentiae]|nr:hypothetical protein TYRP_006571 [Tyrophagus putrescentiae]